VDSGKPLQQQVCRAVVARTPAVPHDFDQLP
jgi:hypothetical protein